MPHSHRPFSFSPPPARSFNTSSSVLYLPSEYAYHDALLCDPLTGQFTRLKLLHMQCEARNVVKAPESSNPRDY
jgi:hypothetical protein